MIRLPLLALSFLICAASAGQTKQCPADARKASEAIWPAGEIQTNMGKTGTHPCGRQMTCVGGQIGSAIKRTCHWN